MKRSLILSAIALALAFGGGAALADAPDIDRFALDNGLELILLRDEATPLAHARLVFRTGAESLSAAEAGSLSILERLVLRGLDDAGASSGAGSLAWRGSVDAESLVFGADFPASELDAALAALASVLAAPPMGELEEAREAAIAEVRASASDPDAIYEAAVNRRLFGKYPWRRDPEGSEASLRAATEASLASLASTRLAPGEAALVVAGNVEPDALRSAAASRLAGWKPAPGARQAAVPHPKPGVARPTWIVYPDPSMPEGSGLVELRYRGPDIARDAAGSLAADLWCRLASTAGGRFAAAVFDAVPGLPSAEGIVPAYASQREGGSLSISSLFEVDPSRPAAERARDFKERVRGFELTEMRADSSYFSKAEYDAAKASLVALRDEELGDAAGAADAIAFWWSVSSIDYFLSYPAAVAALGPRDVAAFIDAYFMKNLEVVALRMNPSDYGRERSSLSASGFATVTEATAFWWSK